MKKILLPLFLASLSIVFYSCGSTASVTPKTPETQTSQAMEGLSGVEGTASQEENQGDEITETVEEIPGTAGESQNEVSPSEAGAPEQEAESEELELISEDELLPEAEEPVVETEHMTEPSVLDEEPASSPSETAAAPRIAKAEDSQNNEERTSSQDFSRPDSAVNQTQTEILASSPSSKPLSQKEETVTSTDTASNAQNTTAEKTSAVLPSVSENNDIGSAQDQTEESSNETEDSVTDEIIPSRSVTVNKNQYLDIVYPGSGWVYLGETQDPKLLTYFGRKLGSGDTTFTLRTKTPGATILHFYKNDALTGSYIDDYLAVTVSPETAKTNEHVKAPSYASVVPPQSSRIRGPEVNEPKKTVTPRAAAQKAQEKKDDAPKAAQAKTQETQAVLPPVADTDGSKTVIQTTASSEKSNETSQSTARTGTTAERPSVVKEETKADANLSLLDQAKQDYEAKRYASALSKVQAYLEQSSVRIDEALFVQGQILEAESDVRDIRSAIDSYDYLTKNYPSSSWWQKANKRSIYLKRFYIDVR